MTDGRCIPDYYQLDMPSFACILAETSGMENDSRSRIVWPSPTRLVFPGGSRPALEAAKRELLEETGFVSDSWVELGGYTVNANQGGAVSYMFHATGCRRIAGPCSDDLEETEILFLSRDELLAAITRGKSIS